MPTLKASHLYTVEILDNNQYQLTGHVWEPIVTVQNLTNPQSLFFEPGDDVLVLNKNSHIGYFTYAGTQTSGAPGDNTGMLVIVPGTNTGWFISGTPREFDTLYTYDSDPHPVCFVKGTLISTTRGAVAIENLVEGDIVQGSSGWRTVKWVGWRSYGANAFKTAENISRIAPVRIRAHAIADNVPNSDLLTSPWHHLFVEGKLARAGDLVNGTTITQETHVTSVSYYHVELDQFDVILAHGIYSESWADGGNRNFFQNVDVTSLRPEDMKRRRAPRPGFDHLVLRKGEALAAIQRRLAQRANVKVRKAA
jgi:hypothetical protein